MKISIWITLLLIIVAYPTFAQDVEMADSFRADGKIYVVVTILSIIVVGLFSYLFYLDRKVSRIENSTTNK